MIKITRKTYSILCCLIVFVANGQISTSTGGAGSILPNSPTSNTNIGIGTVNPIAKLEIAGFPAINKIYTFSDHTDSFIKSVLLNIGTLRENSATLGGERLLTFYDVPPSNIVSNAQTLFAIEDRNDANRLRHHAVANGTSLFRLSDKKQTAFFQIFEDGINAFLDLPKPGSYLTVGGIAVWPIAHNFWVKTGTSKFDNDVFIDTKLGIGTSSPNSQLVIQKNNDAISLNSGTVSGLGFNRNVLDGAIFNISKSAWQFSARDEMFTLEGYNGANHDLFTVLKNGNIGIGTTNPASKLTVAGDINAREVRVTVNAGADFVFEHDYNLPSLTSLDRFIKENKHLPEIASAEEMQKNGINLSELNIKFLQKIEELTLYLIQQNKDMEELKAQMKKILENK